MQDKRGRIEAAGKAKDEWIAPAAAATDGRTFSAARHALAALQDSAPRPHVAGGCASHAHSYSPTRSRPNRVPVGAAS